MKIKVLVFVLLVASHSPAQTLEGLRRINGTMLYFHTIGSGEPIVIVHGGPGMNQSYLIPHLHKLSKKYKIIFYDQRACGKSSVASADSMSMKFFVEDIEAIRKALAVEKLNLLGHSWGIIPVVNYGIQYPDKVDKMIFCNPIPLSKEYDTEMVQNQAGRTSVKDSTDRAIITGSKDFKAGKADAYRKLLLLSFRHLFYDVNNHSRLTFEMPGNYEAASRALYAGLAKDLDHYDYYESSKSFKFPVLILHGMSDAIPLAASQKMQVSIPHAELVLFKKSGHFIFIEERGKFAASVIRFMEAGSK